MKIKQLVPFMLLPLLILLACNSGSLITSTSSSPPTDMATPMQTEAVAPETLSVLPDPLYFISADDQQIWRLERDGVTLIPITHHSTPVTAFDIGRESLAYVTDNDLFRSDLFGHDPFMLVDGPDLPADDLNARLNLEIINPRWPQAGDQITFGMGGVNVIPVSGGEPQLLLPNPSPAIQYRPYSWYVPRLLVEYTESPESGGFVILDPLDTPDVKQPPMQGCCQPSWEPYLGVTVYFANDSGLYAYDLLNEETTTLINNNNPTPIRYPQANGFGSVYFFKGAANNFDDVPMIMYRVGANGQNEEMLRDDSYVMGEALWNFGDPSGAVIVELAPPLEAGPVHGPLVWLPTDGRPAVRLPADGYHLRWSNNNFVP